MITAPVGCDGAPAPCWRCSGSARCPALIKSSPTNDQLPSVILGCPLIEECGAAAKARGEEWFVWVGVEHSPHSGWL
jgi:hypothetical protein